jgi:RNA polymerase-binding transcription factor DksA
MAIEKTNGMDSEMVKELVAAAVAAAVAESRKPLPLTEEQESAKQQNMEMRRQQAELIKADEARKKLEQEACSHTRRDGSTTGVYVQDGNYIICQQCQKVIRPEVEPALFSRLLQLATPAIF